VDTIAPGAIVSGMIQLCIHRVHARMLQAALVGAKVLWSNNHAPANVEYRPVTPSAMSSKLTSAYMFAVVAGELCPSCLWVYRGYSEVPFGSSVRRLSCVPGDFGWRLVECLFLEASNPSLCIHTWRDSSTHSLACAHHCPTTAVHGARNSATLASACSSSGHRLWRQSSPLERPSLL